jgi:hypothetical protein
LAILAASFLLVTTRELNNGIRPAQTTPKETGDDAAGATTNYDTQYLQLTHWKLPPDEAMRLVSEHLVSRYPHEQLLAMVMEKILVSPLLFLSISS